MHDDRTSLGEAVAELMRLSRTVAPGGLSAAVRSAAAHLGASAADLWLVDYDEVTLVPLDRAAESFAVEGTLAGRAYWTGEPVVLDRDATSVDAFLPLTEGTDPLGVLRLAFASAPAPPTLAAAGHFASVVAQLVVTKRAYGDDLELIRRQRDMDLAAELRWSLLPPRTFTDEQVAVAGVLEPAYQIAGDCFDYAVTETVAHLAVFDAMGHGLEASRLANLALVSYRHARRRRLGLPEIAAFIDQAMQEQFGPDRFTTAQLATLDLSRGVLQMLSAGHPRPLLVRHDKLLGELPCDPRPPLGLAGFPTDVAEVALEPGDQVVFYSDGLTEARSPDGEQFGVERLGDFIIKAALAHERPAATVRRLIRSVLAHVEGQLSDDATVVLLAWRNVEG